MSKNYSKEIINIIKIQRKKKKLSLRALAEKCGVSNAYLSQLESDKRDNPSIGLICKLFKELNISVKITVKG